MIQRQTLVQDEKQQEQYEASVEVEDAEETADAAQENSLMLVRGMVDDDMEHIADMKEQFSQTIDPILRMYNAAMCATTARLEIIEDEFKYRKLLHLLRTDTPLCRIYVPIPNLQTGKHKKRMPNRRGSGCGDRDAEISKSSGHYGLHPSI